MRRLRTNITLVNLVTPRTSYCYARCSVSDVFIIVGHLKDLLLQTASCTLTDIRFSKTDRSSTGTYVYLETCSFGFFFFSNDKFSERLPCTTVNCTSQHMPTNNNQTINRRFG